jgi:molybdopterin converting factor small subunit
VISVELFEGARRLAGVASVRVEGATLGEALDAVRRVLPALEPRVLVPGGLAPHWRANLNGRRFVEDPATPLQDGDAILLVSALAGG